MKLLGVLGNPVRHSRSPEIHDSFAASCGLKIEYRKVFVPEGKFIDVATAFMDEGAVGFNVTVPDKSNAYAFVDETSIEAEKAQAVNTVQSDPDGRLVGYNTDGPGIVADIANQGWSLYKKRILVVGAGGAVRGVVGSLLEENPDSIDIVNRSHQKAVEIAERMEDSRLAARPIADLDNAYDIVISGSSAGLSENSGPVQLPARIVDEHSLCYDMIYRDNQTPFLQWCQANNCAAICDGLGMLVEQAAFAFEIWFGHKVSTRPVINQLRGR